jgi:hypothetical protein
MPDQDSFTALTNLEKSFLIIEIGSTILVNKRLFVETDLRGIDCLVICITL